MDKYRLIIADPPWAYNDQGTRLSPAYEGKQRKSGKHYDTMSLAEICALGDWVRWITEKDAILLLWCTHPYSTAIPWVKARWDEKQQRFIYQIGGGKTTRSCSEEILVCTKGKGASLVVDRGISGAIIAPKTGHSVKPIEQYLIAERMVPGGPYLEMYARAWRPGWDAWGDEVS